MTAQTVAASSLAISAGTPATFNIVGYQALSFTTIGEVVDMGEHGREYALVTHNPIATRGTQKFKGSFNEGGKTIQLAIDHEDAGQILARTALTSDSNYSFKQTYQNGDIEYFQAKVMSFKTQLSSVDTILSGTIMLEITTSSTGVGIVLDVESVSPDV